MPIEPANASQLPQLQAALVSLEQQMLGATALAVVRRSVFWRSLMTSASGAGMSASDVAALLGADTVQANQDADNDARGYAMLLAGLARGELVVVPWSAGTEQGGGAIQLGIARAGDNNLGQWALLPVIVRVAVQVVVGVGAWVIANAWTHANELKAKADQVRANTQAKISQAVTALAATNPQAATALAGALANANQAVGNAQPGWIDQILGTLRDVGAGVGSGLSSGLVWVALAWFLSRRRAA
jgi:hypothetical protein